MKTHKVSDANPNKAPNQCRQRVDYICDPNSDGGHPHIYVQKNLHYDGYDYDVMKD